MSFTSADVLRATEIALQKHNVIGTGGVAPTPTIELIAQPKYYTKGFLSNIADLAERKLSANSYVPKPTYSYSIT